MRKKLLDIGYSVGQIGTEPSALLFGMDKVFPCGYNPLVKLNNFNTYAAVNQMIWDITNKDVDIIIAGSQSGLLAYNDNNISMTPLYHQIYFEALQPDLIIVCANSFDEIKFVDRVIKTAEGLSNGKVLGAVCFPVDFDNSWKGNFGMKSRISIEKENELKNLFHEKLNLDLFMLDNERELDILLQKCLLYLS